MRALAAPMQGGFVLFPRGPGARFGRGNTPRRLSSGVANQGACRMISKARRHRRDSRSRPFKTRVRRGQGRPGSMSWPSIQLSRCAQRRAAASAMACSGRPPSDAAAFR